MDSRVRQYSYVDSPKKNKQTTTVTLNPRAIKCDLFEMSSELGFEAVTNLLINDGNRAKHDFHKLMYEGYRYIGVEHTRDNPRHELVTYVIMADERIDEVEVQKSIVESGLNPVRESKDSQPPIVSKSSLPVRVPVVVKADTQ